MEQQFFEDVSPIQNVDVPAMLVYWYVFVYKYESILETLSLCVQWMSRPLDKMKSKETRHFV